VGDGTAWLIIDDTALPKKGRHSVVVAPQYASALGKSSNRQTLVSPTLTSGKVPVMVALRMFLPDSWTSEPDKLDCVAAAIIHTFSRTGRIDKLSGNLCRSDDSIAVRDRMVSFMAGGFLTICGPRRAAFPVPK
jgi:hypothetical protein